MDGNIGDLDLKSKEAFFADREFLQTYIKDNVVVICHLFACFLQAFSGIIGLATMEDLEILSILLSKFIKIQKD